MTKKVQSCVRLQAESKIQKFKKIQEFWILDIFFIFLYRIDFQEPKDPSHWIPGEKMVHFDVKTIVLAQKL